MVDVGYFYLWYKLNVGQCTNIYNVKWQRALRSMTRMLQVGQKKGTECDEMRKFFAECHCSDNREGDKKQLQ